MLVCANVCNDGDGNFKGDGKMEKDCALSWDFDLLIGNVNCNFVCLCNIY